MDTAGIPNDIVMKVHRAEYHLTELERCTEDFVANSTIMKTRQLDTGKGVYVYRFQILKPPDELGLIASDFIHNLRSALDHLTWQLGLKYFPIYKEKLKENYLENEIKALSLKAQEAIKQIQPYQRGETWMHDPLWLLHDMWNCDKHRTTIAVTKMTPSSFVGAGARCYVDNGGDIVWEIPPLAPPYDKNEPRVSVQVIFEWETHLKDIDKGINTSWTRTTSVPQFRQIYEFVIRDILPRFSGLLA